MLLALFEPELFELLLLDPLLFELFVNRLNRVARPSSASSAASAAATCSGVPALVVKSAGTTSTEPAGAAALVAVAPAGEDGTGTPFGTAGARLAAVDGRTGRVSGQACASCPEQPARASAAAITAAAGPVRILIRSPPCPGAAARSRSPAAAA
ncbi:hypothetical protein [Kitasatospora sp. NPDC057015]|uniref:hypothetical protein n=1 Tax=Kitasatospora sp. NPDC057015 TaxID=3346001 RepID=UPI003630D979